MQLEHTFTVPAEIEQAWQVLLDIERVAPCMPGAALDTVDGDDFTGTVKVRLGPIGLTYKGKASFVEKNEAEHRAVIDAHGRDARGNGTASAKVTATLAADGEQSTQVTVLTDLNITGKPAQFGRGVMVDVGNKLIGQFADCLAGKLAGPEAPAEPAESAVEAEPVAAAATEPIESAAAAAAGLQPTGDGTPLEQPTPAAAEIAAGEPPAEAPVPTPAARPRTVTPSHEVEPIDLLGSAGPAVAKRLAPVAVMLAVAVAVWLILRRRR